MSSGIRPFPIASSKLNAIAGALFMLSIAHFVEGQTECELKKQKDDLKVYTCSSDDSKLKVLKAELTLPNTTFNELLDFVSDIDNYVNWQFNTTESKVLKERGRSVIFRNVVDAPWPLSKREMILEHSHAFDSIGQVLTIESKTVSYEYPETEDLIRVPFSASKWRVTSVNRDLRIEYILRIDPGGSVPTWLVNIAMAEGPYSSFINLKEQLKKKRP